MGVADFGASNAISTIGGIVGAVLGSGSKVAEQNFIPTDINKAVGDANSANLKNFDASANVAAKSNLFNTDQIKQMLSAIAPDWQKIVGQQEGVIQNQLSGNLPQGTQDFLTRAAASRGVASGVGGSPFGSNISLESLGLNSLGQIQQGFNNAQNWLASAQARLPNPMSVQSMFISPAQSIAVQQSNNQGQMQTNWLNSQIRAAPDPMMAAIGQAIASGAGNAGAAAGIGQGNWWNTATAANNGLQSNSGNSFSDMIQRANSGNGIGFGTRFDGSQSNSEFVSPDAGSTDLSSLAGMV